jgi:hypothetical protein
VQTGLKKMRELYISGLGDGLGSLKKGLGGRLVQYHGEFVHQIKASLPIGRKISIQTVFLNRFA